MRTLSHARVFGVHPDDHIRSRHADVDLRSVEQDMIRLALRSDVDMRLYIPEIMSLCFKLGPPDLRWFEDEAVRDRVVASRDNMPLFAPRSEA